MRKMPATKDHRLIPPSEIAGVGQSVKNTGAMVSAMNIIEQMCLCVVLLDREVG